MMKKFLNYHILTLSAIVCLFACKKDKSSNLERPEPIKPPESRKMVPIKFESAGSTIHLKYKNNTAVLTEIDEGSGNKIVISYTAQGFPGTLEKYKKAELYKIVYFILDDQKKASKAVTFDYDHLSDNYTPTGFYTLAYNELGLIHTIKYFNHNDVLVNTVTKSYTAQGSLTEVNLMTNQGSKNKISYTFDQQKGTSSLIPYIQLFTFEADHWFLFCFNNNMLRSLNQNSPAENIELNYIYNQDGYPTNLKLSKVTSTQNVVITYKTLE